MKYFTILLSSLNFFSVAAFAGQTIGIKNTTQFFLHKVTGDSCPALIQPGDVAQISGYCGYDACATNKFDPLKGCLEIANKNNPENLTEGGYATYLGINSWTNLCSVAEFNNYRCSINTNGDFNLNYVSVAQKFTGGPSVGQIVSLPNQIQNYATGPIFRGVNLSGLEYDGSYLDALFQHPDIPDALYFTQKGMNTIRLPIRWEFIIGSKNNVVQSIIANSQDSQVDINSVYLAGVYDTLQKYLSHGLNVILDLHNYMRFCPTGAEIGQGNEPTDPVNNGCKIVSSQELANIWKTILTAKVNLQKEDGSSEVTSISSLAINYNTLNSKNQLMFELMNEPFSQSDQTLSTQEVFDNEIAATKSIRENGGDKNYILLSGNEWDPLHAWTTSNNATQFTSANLQNSLGDISNIAVDVHQYFDADFSGRSATCTKYNSQEDFEQKLNLVQFRNWMQHQGMKVFLGEFGASISPDCQSDLNYMLTFIQNNSFTSTNPTQGGFLGWTIWRGNRNGQKGAYGSFSYIQQGNSTVYGAPANGHGILQGEGNSLIDDLFVKNKYLIPPM